MGTSLGFIAARRSRTVCCWSAYPERNSADVKRRTVSGWLVIRDGKYVKKEAALMVEVMMTETWLDVRSTIIPAEVALESSSSIK